MKGWSLSPSARGVEGVVSLKQFDLLYSTTYTVGVSSPYSKRRPFGFQKSSSPPLNRNFHLMLSPYDFIELNLIERLKRCPDVFRLVNSKISTSILVDMLCPDLTFALLDIYTF